jgi:hypothetical protein
MTIPEAAHGIGAESFPFRGCGIGGATCLRAADDRV